MASSRRNPLTFRLECCIIDLYLFNVLQNFGAEENRFLNPFFFRTGEDDPGKSFIVGASAGRRVLTCANSSSKIFNFPIHLGGVFSTSLQPANVETIKIYATIFTVIIYNLKLNRFHAN